MLEQHGIMSPDIIPALICHPTRGRTISLANHAHPPEGKRINALSMSERHGIMFAAINVVSCKKYPRYFAAVVWMETNSV